MGKKLGPSAEKGRPTIPLRLAMYWTAFSVLHKRRQFAYTGPQPLSIPQIESYARLSFIYGPRYFSRLLRFVAAMDDVYLANFFKKQKSEGDLK